jgi:hypothetical protein
MAMWAKRDVRSDIPLYTAVQSPAAVEPARQALEAIARTTFSGSEQSDDYMRGNRDAHATCASMARAALARSPAECRAQAEPDFSDPIANGIMGAARLVTHDQETAYRITSYAMETIGADLKQLRAQVEGLKAKLAGTFTQVCGTCGHPWDGNGCAQKDNGHPFQTCYPIAVPVEAPDADR